MRPACAISYPSQGLVDLSHRSLTSPQAALIFNIGACTQLAPSRLVNSRPLFSGLVTQLLVPPFRLVSNMWFRNGPTTSWVLAVSFLALTMSMVPAWAAFSSPEKSHPLENDLYALLHDTTLSQDKGLSEALSWLSNLPSESSCIQMAATKLMTECKMLENPSDFAKAHPEWYLDDLKSEYAVKLAICEIVGAQPDLPYAPQHCDVFFPTTEACNKRSWLRWGRSEASTSDRLPCYPAASDKSLHQCLKTLRSSPQYWTSFSNAKFHAEKMCQFSRHAIEREKTLQLHKNLTEVTVRLQSSLRRVASEVWGFQTQLRESREEHQLLSEEMKQLAKQYNDFVQEVRKDAQQERELAKKGMQSVQLDIGNSSDTILSNLSTFHDNFNAEMDAAMVKATLAIREGYFDVLKAMAMELEHVSRSLRDEQSKLAREMGLEIQQHHEKALIAVQVQHGAMVESFNIMRIALDNSHQKFDNLNDKMDLLANKTDKSVAKVTVLSHRLDGLESKIRIFERVLALLQPLFSALGLCLIVAGFLALPILFTTGRTLLKLRLFASVLIILTGFLYLFDAHDRLDWLHVPWKYLFMGIPHTFLEYIKDPSAAFLVASMICCFIGAAFLPKINRFCDDFIDRATPLPRTLPGWLGHGQLQQPSSLDDSTFQVDLQLPDGLISYPSRQYDCSASKTLR